VDLRLLYMVEWLETPAASAHAAVPGASDLFLLALVYFGVKSHQNTR